MTGKISMVLLVSLGFCGAAQAQTVIDAGKTPAQLFATDCAPCHKTPAGLAKSTMGLSGFLRQHYVSSRQNADALAAYLQGAGDGSRRQAAPTQRKRDGKPADKKDEAKPGESKPATTPAAAKPDDKPAESKPAAASTESRPAEAKPSESKPSESKPAESKPAEAPAAKPAE